MKNGSAHLERPRFFYFPSVLFRAVRASASFLGAGAGAVVQAITVGASAIVAALARRSRALAIAALAVVTARTGFRRRVAPGGLRSHDSQRQQHYGREGQGNQIDLFHRFSRFPIRLWPNHSMIVVLFLFLQTGRKRISTTHHARKGGRMKVGRNFRERRRQGKIRSRQDRRRSGESD